MSGIRSITRNATRLGYATPNSAPIYVDSDDNKLKFVPAGSGSTEVEIIDASSSQTLTNKTLTNPTIGSPTPVTVTTTPITLGPTHANRVTVLNKADGIALTLPAATGSGDVYELWVKTTATSDITVAVASATDYMVGLAWLQADSGATVVGFATANTGTVATESDTITFTGSDSSTGGIKGAKIRLVDIASAVWGVEVYSDAAASEATPFSAAV